MTERIQVFAVVRLDDPDRATPLSVTVKEILPTEDAAEAEVRRLNELNAHTGARYHWQATRYYPTGRKGKRAAESDNAGVGDAGA